MLIITLLDILALDILGLDILGMIPIFNSYVHVFMHTWMNGISLPFEPNFLYISPSAGNKHDHEDFCCRVGRASEALTT